MLLIIFNILSLFSFIRFVVACIWFLSCRRFVSWVILLCNFIWMNSSRVCDFVATATIGWKKQTIWNVSSVGALEPLWSRTKQIARAWKLRERTYMIYKVWVIFCRWPEFMNFTCVLMRSWNLLSSHFVRWLSFDVCQFRLTIKYNGQSILRWSESKSERKKIRMHSEIHVDSHIFHHFCDRASTIFDELKHFNDCRRYFRSIYVCVNE